MSKVGRLPSALCVAGACVPDLRCATWRRRVWTTSDAAADRKLPGLLRRACCVSGRTPLSVANPSRSALFLCARAVLRASRQHDVDAERWRCRHFLCVRGWSRSGTIRWRPSMAAPLARCCCCFAFRSGCGKRWPACGIRTSRPPGCFALLVVTATSLRARLVGFHLWRWLASRQAHVAVMPALLLVRWFSRAHAQVRWCPPTHAWRRSLVVTGCALLVAWVLPAWEQLTGNSARQHHRAVALLRAAVTTWSDAGNRRVCVVRTCSPDC